MVNFDAINIQHILQGCKEGQQQSNTIILYPPTSLDSNWAGQKLEAHFSEHHN